MVKQTSQVSKFPILKAIISFFSFIFLLLFFSSLVSIPFLSNRRIYTPTVTLESKNVQQGKYMFGGSYYYLRARAMVEDYSLTKGIKFCYSQTENLTLTCYNDLPNQKVRVYVLKRNIFSSIYELKSQDTFDEDNMDQFIILSIIIGSIFIIIIILIISYFIRRCRKINRENQLSLNDVGEKTFYLELNGIQNFPISEKYYFLFSETLDEDKELIEDTYHTKFPFYFFHSILYLIITYLTNIGGQLMILTFLSVDMSLYGYILLFGTSFLFLILFGFELFPPYFVKYYILTDKGFIEIIDYFYGYILERYRFQDIIHVECIENLFIIHTKIDKETGKTRSLKLKTDQSKFISKLTSLMNLNQRENETPIFPPSPITEETLLINNYKAEN